MILQLLHFLTWNQIVGSNLEEAIDYYENLINYTFGEANNYELPRNALQYYPNSSTIEDFGEFDFIIIGSGTAGSVLVNRLSEISNWKVLALEAGEFENDFVDIPAYNLVTRLTKYNWGYESTPQKSCCLGFTGKKCPYPRGKGPGGSSLLNAVLYVRGNKIDFDRWASRGLPTWSYSKVLPYFRKAENANIAGDFGYHGFKGPLHVQHVGPLSEITKAFLKAGRELGLVTEDYNGVKQVGCGILQNNIVKGRRDSNARAYVLPALKRNNLVFLTKAFATKIMFDSLKPKSVRFVRENKEYLAHAKKEIILSAGVIDSPKLLMLSGIGPRQHLKSLGIPVVKELQVGEKLLDHPMFTGLYFNTNHTEPVKPLREYIREYLRGSGDLTIPAQIQAVLFNKTKFSGSLNWPDLESILVPPGVPIPITPRALGFSEETTEAIEKNVKARSSFQFGVVQLHPKSHGTLKLKSKSPYDYPLIDSRYLSHPEDLESMYQYVQMMINFVNTAKSLREINATLVKIDLPACRNNEFLSEGYWKCVIKYMTFSIYHPVGTCFMGKDSSGGAVVDEYCTVHGVDGLRVADASIFPFTLSGHPAAVATMIGEKISDVIKKKYLFGKI